LLFDNDEGMAAFLFKSYSVFKQTVVETNIWGLFARLDLSSTSALSLTALSFMKKY
jgi:hypothetical protein